MSFIGRIEYDAEAETFRAVYLTGAAEWSLNAADAFRGTRAECEALAARQPLRGMLFGRAEACISPADVYEKTCERLGEHSDE